MAPQSRAATNAQRAQAAMQTDSRERLFRLVASNSRDSRLRLYRGTALDKMSPGEVADLLQGGGGGPGLRSVIDIRTKEEIGGCDTYPLPEGVTYRVTQLTSSGSFAEVRPAENPQVTFYRVDFYTLTKKLRIFSTLFWNNWRLAMTGWRSDRFDASDGLKMGVLKKLSADVANSRGPVGLYLDWLDPGMDCSGLVGLFRLLSDPAVYPALVHCQYGKDRTGVVCTLLQMMDPSLTVEDVVDEYHSTETQIARFLPEIGERVRRAGLPPEMGHCPKELIREVIAWIQSRYGTVEQYLQQIGLRESEVTAIKTALGYSTPPVEQEGQNAET